MNSSEGFTWFFRILYLCLSSSSKSSNYQFHPSGRQLNKIKQLNSIKNDGLNDNKQFINLFQIPFYILVYKSEILYSFNIIMGNTETQLMRQQITDEHILLVASSGKQQVFQNKEMGMITMPLHGVIADIRKFKQKFRNKNLDSIVTSRDCKILLSKTYIINWLQGKFNSTTKDIFLFYTGHGHYNGDWAIQTIEKPQGDTITLEELLEIWRESIAKQSHLYIFMDSCHSGGWCHRLAMSDLKMKVSIFASCNVNQTSKDLSQGGLLFRCLFGTDSQQLQQDLMLLNHKDMKQTPEFINGQSGQGLLQSKHIRSIQKNIFNATKIVPEKCVNNQDIQQRNSSGFILNQYFKAQIQRYDKIASNCFMNRNKIIAIGSYSTAYKGFQPISKTFLVIKFLDKKIFSRYELPIEKIFCKNQLKHQNIMTCFGTVQRPEGFYYLIQFCRQQLSQFIKIKIPQSKVFQLLKQIVSAMTFLNSKNLIYKDFNPNNIFLDYQGNVKIQLNPQICTIEELYEDQDPEILGFPLYNPPQAHLCEPQGLNSNVWNTGLVLYQMLTNRRYFHSVKNKFSLLKQINKFKDQNFKVVLPKNLHPIWQQILAKMLIYNPQKRIQFKNLSKYLQQIQGTLKSNLIQGDKLEIKRINKFIRLSHIDQTYPDRQSQTIDFSILNPEKIEQKFAICRKWIAFFIAKITKIGDLILNFKRYQNSFFKSDTKLVLIFLCLCFCITQMNNFIIQIKQKVIVTPNYIMKILLNSKSEVQKNIIVQLQNALLKIQQIATQYQKILNNQIIQQLKKFRSNFSKFYEIKGNQRDVLKIIDMAKVCKYEESQIYINIFNQILNSPQARYSIKQLQIFNHCDVRAYAQIQIIGRFNQIINDRKYQQGLFYLIKFEEILEKATKEDFLLYIACIQ